jgi:hypothetical protein
LFVELEDIAEDRQDEVEEEEAEQPATPRSISRRSTEVSSSTVIYPISIAVPAPASTT